MSLAFIDRNPSKDEFERFRLILSTYQDGSGQQSAKDGKTVPGWRDFERSVALAFGGTAMENKYIFDVLFPDSKRQGVFWGLSCKMRRTLNDTVRSGRVTIELSNSSGKFWERLRRLRINQGNYKKRPIEVAHELIGQVRDWHKEVGVAIGGKIDLTKSFYLALSWNLRGDYQLFKFPLNLPDPTRLTWDFPTANRTRKGSSGKHLRGQDENGTVIEWYGESGGQLKYYPLVTDALWQSKVFRLEPLPKGWETLHGIEKKAKDYFPIQWK